MSGATLLLLQYVAFVVPWPQVQSERLLNTFVVELARGQSVPTARNGSSAVTHDNARYQKLRQLVYAPTGLNKSHDDIV